MLCRAPLSFFHVTPTGRIINRLTKDTSDVDKNLADFAAFFLRSCLQLFSTIILVGVTTPFALPFLVPILLLFYFLYQYFQVGPFFAPCPGALPLSMPTYLQVVTAWFALQPATCLDCL